MNSLRIMYKSSKSPKKEIKRVHHDILGRRCCPSDKSQKNAGQRQQPHTTPHHTHPQQSTPLVYVDVDLLEPGAGSHLNAAAPATHRHAPRVRPHAALHGGGGVGQLDAWTVGWRWCARVCGFRGKNKLRNSKTHSLPPHKVGVI